MDEMTNRQEELIVAADLLGIDYDKLWASSGGTQEIGDNDYRKGFDYLGVEPPTVEEFNWILQQLDKKCQDLNNRVKSGGIKFTKLKAGTGEVDATKADDVINFAGKGDILITVSNVGGLPTVTIDDGASDVPIWDKFKWDKQKWAAVTNDAELSAFIKNTQVLNDEELLEKYNGVRIKILYFKLKKLTEG